MSVKINKEKGFMNKELKGSFGFQINAGSTLAGGV